MLTLFTMITVLLGAVTCGVEMYTHLNHQAHLHLLICELYSKDASRKANTREIKI